MHTIVEDVERPDGDVVAGFEGIPAAVIADVTGKYECIMDADVKPIWDVESMVGTAITVKTYPGDNLMIHRALTLTEPGDVLVVDANEYIEAGLWGELLSTSARTNGLAGTIVDGAVRDVKATANLGYPVYARAVSPKGSYKARPGSINVSISCGGVSVDPGDIVIGDAEGVAVVEAEAAEAVLEDARAKLDAEAEVRRRVKEGEYIYDLQDYESRFERLDVHEQ